MIVVSTIDTLTRCRKSQKWRRDLWFLFAVTGGHDHGSQHIGQRTGLKANLQRRNLADAMRLFHSFAQCFSNRSFVVLCIHFAGAVGRGGLHVGRDTRRGLVSKVAAADEPANRASGSGSLVLSNSIEI